MNKEKLMFNCPECNTEQEVDLELESDGYLVVKAKCGFVKKLDVRITDYINGDGEKGCSIQYRHTIKSE